MGSLIRMRKSRILGISALGAVALLVIGLIFFRPYASPEAAACALRFMEALQEGRIDEAYALTDRGADVGKDIKSFAAKEDVVFVSASRHPFSLAGASPMQSRGWSVSFFEVHAE
jgi:hypothetical protein